MEAWLLADTKALNTALELNPPASTTKAPETMYAGPGQPGHPKTEFANLVGRSSKAPAEAYDAVAERMDLAELERRCPKGFKAFADELRKRCK